MNLLNAARGLTNPFNAILMVEWVRSTGYTTDASGHRTPTTEARWVKAQVQNLSSEEIRHSDMLNLMGIQRTVYLHDPAAGTIRASKKGGDILKFADCPDGTINEWLVTEVVERWDNWTRVLVTMQVTHDA